MVIVARPMVRAARNKVLLEQLGLACPTLISSVSALCSAIHMWSIGCITRAVTGEETMREAISLGSGSSTLLSRVKPGRSTRGRQASWASNSAITDILPRSTFPYWILSVRLTPFIKLAKPQTISVTVHHQRHLAPCQFSYATTLIRAEGAVYRCTYEEGRAPHRKAVAAHRRFEIYRIVIRHCTG